MTAEDGRCADIFGFVEHTCLRRIDGIDYVNFLNYLGDRLSVSNFWVQYFRTPTESK